jgi:hypothetical protein
MRLFKITLVISLLIGNIPTYSQTTDKGLLLGFSGSQIIGAQQSVAGFAVYNKLGLDAGFFLKHHFNEFWSLVYELKYIQKGSFIYQSNDNYDYLRTNLQYLELPIYFTRSISKNFEAEFGLAAAYLLNATTYTPTTGIQPLNTGIHNYDASALLGITYLYNDKFNINLKISYSLVPIDYSASYITWQNNLGRYNNVAELAVYYKL